MALDEDLLLTDFEQCFEQLRHYDQSFTKTIEFTFGGVAAVITAAAALVGNYGTNPKVVLAIGLLLGISSLGGFLLVISLGRNRVYFARVARYVNEIRALYLSRKPGGLQNEARFFADPKYPPIFNPLSTHTFQIYFLSLCNALLFGCSTAAILFYCRLNEGAGPFIFSWRLGLLAVGAFFAAQIIWVLAYWLAQGARKKASSKKE